MTLIEIMVVLGVVGLLAGAFTVGLGRVLRTDLRHDAGRLAAAMRSAFDRAAATGAHHQLQINLDEGTFRIERCEGNVRLRRSTEEASQQDKEEIAAKQALFEAVQSGAAQTAGGGASPVDAAALVAAKAAGQTACTPARGELGLPQRLKKSRGIRVARVYAGHLEDPVESGEVTLHFFENGRAERAVVEVAGGEEDVFSLVVQPLTGRVRMIAGPFKHPEEFVHRDAEGKETDTP